jgi:nicotinamide phosphoribosyltransferase
MQHNLILLADCYKVSHHRLYPPGTERLYSYFESRGGAFEEVVFFGLQYYLKEYLEGPLVVTREKIDEADGFFRQHLGPGIPFNRAGWEYILLKYGGRLPISIRAVPEGTVLPVRNVLMTVENTDPQCYWLTNYLESLLVQVWYGCTVASLSREMKKVLLRFLEASGDPARVDGKLHDFGFRGVSSVESAGLGGAAHLTNFRGSDNMAALTTVRRYYSGRGDDAPLIDVRGPATEHSTITAWGEEGEAKAFAHILDEFSSGPVACVSDSYDLFRVCAEYFGRRLRDRVLQRDGVVIIRPDSGDPPQVACQVLDLLGECFGWQRNAKGFKLLDPHIRILQGDGIDIAIMQTVLQAMQDRGWSADNIGFGCGGGLLQRVNRDTLKFAYKCSSITVNGEERPVHKRPATDPGKQSKAGRLKLVMQDDRLTTAPASDPRDDLLVEVFRDGCVLVSHSFADIRERAGLRNSRG